VVVGTAVGGGQRRLVPAADGGWGGRGCRYLIQNRKKPGKTEEGEQSTAATAGHRRAKRWQRQLPAACLGDGRGPAPAAGGSERREKRRRQKRGVHG